MVIAPLSCGMHNTISRVGAVGCHALAALCMALGCEAGLQETCRSGKSSHRLLAISRWVDMKEMAAEAVAAAKDKRLTIIPSEFEATWFRQATVHLAQVQPLVLDGLSDIVRRCDSKMIDWLVRKNNNSLSFGYRTEQLRDQSHDLQFQVAGEHQGLVHQPAAVVGPQDPGLVCVPGGR